MQESKSIGADVNWGVRFKNLKDVSSPLNNIVIWVLYTDTYCDTKHLLNPGTTFSVQPLQGGFITFAGMWSDREEVYLKGLFLFSAL